MKTAMEKMTDVDKSIDPVSRRRSIRDCRVFANRVDPDAPLPTGDAQQSCVVHLFEQARGRARRTAPVVGHRPMREVAVHFPRVHFTSLANIRQYALGTRAR